MLRYQTYCNSLDNEIIIFRIYYFTLQITFYMRWEDHRRGEFGDDISTISW